MDMTEEGDDFPRELRRNARNRPPTTRYYERDIGEALDPHLAVDPEDRPYLMDEYEDDGRETIRSGRGMSKARRDIGEALDPHLAVDPEDRPYLLDKYEDDSSRRGKGSRSKAEKKTNESYRARRDYNNEKRRDTSSLPSSKTDLVCIDGSAGADRGTRRTQVTL
jgi:beta-xylosidase